MKRYFSSLRTQFCFLVCFAGFVLLSSSVMAQVELSLQIGFEGKVTPGRYAPIQIEVLNYRDFGSARLRIIQAVGNEWRGEATIQQELGYAIQSDGLYEAVIPTYDPVNLIVVELVSSTNTVLASVETDLRGTMRPAPYPVLDKTIPRFDDRAAVIDTASLPTQWWAFDSAESLWVASPLPSETWTAISQWVLAGGSLVLLTGTDFYRMDSPILREMLPLSNPVLAESNLGTIYLSGTLREATVGMVSDEGFPLLIQSPYGAGHVALITVQAQSMAVEILEGMGKEVTPSKLISLRDPTEFILGDQKIVTLNSLLVLAMIVILGVGVCACALIGRRKPKLGWAILLVGVMGISVSSGFLSNPVKLVIDMYAVTTHFYADTSFSLYAVFSSLYSRTNDPFVQPHREGIIPVQWLPRTLKGKNSYDSSTFPGLTEKRMLSGEIQHWHGYGGSSSMFDVRLLSDSLIRISNQFGLDFTAGWVLIDGVVHSIGDIHRGIDDYRFDLEPVVRLAAFVSSAYADEIPIPALVLIRELRQSFPLEKGIWLLAFADDEKIVSGEITQKVRDITLVAVQGEGGAREI